MKPGQFTSLIALFFCMISCASKNHNEASKDNNDIDTTILVNYTTSDSFPPGKVVPKVVCKANAAQSYALYIPVKNNNEPLPVVYFFDPHGDGLLPLVKYKTLADKYDFIFIGSNDSKNGIDWSTDENIWNTMFDDSQKRLKINDNRIYTCGFSGGAKVASFVALNHTVVKGVIANGAGLQEITNAGNFKFSFTAITGEGDMNRSDLIAINKELDKTDTKHRIIFFDGIHEWAPEDIMNIAFSGFQFDAMEEKLIPVDSSFVNNFIANSKKRIATFTRSNNFIRAQEECKLAINMLGGITSGVNWFKEEDASIQNNGIYVKQLEKEQNLEVAERKIKEVFSQQFQAGDMNYWVKTINDLKIKAKAKTPEGAMYQRLQAYLSLAFYSISNQLINAGKNIDAAYFVDLYTKADPTNSEGWYFSAILDARNKNAKATEDDLLKAVANGFNDKNRLMEQPEFKQLGAQINLSKIENKMK